MPTGTSGVPGFYHIWKINQKPILFLHLWTLEHVLLAITGKMSGNESDTGQAVKRSHLLSVGDRRKNIP